MNPRFYVYGIAFSLLLPLTAAAQTNPENRLIGWANSGQASSAGQIEIQDINPSCRPATVQCSNIGSFSGSGLAYDSVNQTAWVCDGSTIYSYSLASTNCTFTCRAKPAMRDATARITALAIDPGARLLWHLETKLGYAAIQPYDIKGCPSPLRGGCVLKLQSNETAGGLAYDRVNNLFFVSVSSPAFVGYISSIKVIDPTNCTELCSMAAPPCDVRTQPAVTGLAYDHCAKRIYYSTGPDTNYVQIGDARKCQYKAATACCSKGGKLPWADIDILPGWTGKAIGNGCVGKGCASCTQLVMGSGGGDPVLGNQGFFLTVRGTPISSVGAVYVGAGACGQGVTVPGLCGPFYPNLGSLFFVAGVPLNGRTQCTGAANVPLAIPNDAGICGAKVCFQTLVVCASSGVGFTGALDFQFGKN